MVQPGFWDGIVALATVCWLAGWVWWCLKKLSDGWEGSALFAILVHALLCGSPLLLDLVVGRPSYSGLLGIARATTDFDTALIYALYVSIVPVIVVWVAPVRRIRLEVARSDSNPPPLPASEMRILGALLISPIVLVLFAPIPEIYLEYTPYQRGLAYRPEAAFFHVFVGLATLSSILASGVILLRSPLFWRAFAKLSPLIISAIWLNGKRNLAAIAVVFLGYVVWRRGLLRGRNLIRVGAMLSIAFVAFSVFYQLRVRFSDELVAVRVFEDWYTEFRIDYGRDDVVKLVIFREINPDYGSILEYRGQSLAIYATAMLPRRFWPDKPASYPYRVSAAASERQLSARGGALTTTILGEAIANASWFGFLLAPMMIGGLCLMADRAPRRSLFQCTAFFFTIFLQATHLLAVYVLFVGWAFFAFIKFFTSPRRPSQAAH